MRGPAINRLGPESDDDSRLYVGEAGTLPESAARVNSVEDAFNLLDSGVERLYGAVAKLEEVLYPYLRPEFEEKSSESFNSAQVTPETQRSQFYYRVEGYQSRLDHVESLIRQLTARVDR